MKRNNAFRRFCEQITDELFVIDDSVKKRDYVPIDLSVGNPDLREIDITSAEAMERYIQQLIDREGGQVAYGGYLEVRNLYQRSRHFKNPNSPLHERNIHLGVDVWSPAGTDVLAVLDGEVHSFANNSFHGDYGPTIILKHSFDDLVFYTLYGHLSILSIPDLEMGQEFKQGEVIGQLGDSLVNGDYAPHLHFQVILDMGDHFGDFPGVCSKEEINYYMDACPDPMLLLRI
ncbi:peptidoglycan DD-metalloendopeptidase family protein [Parvicella tangerina]|uniref:M23ase beta-sheet core domain-containing protein n=1 Tax=Parvicella tangerina TaxID=2829795 RepID=A0A916JNV9_9FLAO|nr:peptidoglycan DD-metalloendopeptidase family protein [Parvicella tangerina]CAG5082936.1 hypothetical protein CRYO30217_02047 [Parvicella tangerina]